MAILAIVLFTGTIIWSSFKIISHPVKRYDRQEMEIGQTPDRVTGNSHFFQAEYSHSIRIDAPVLVELDDSFEGVELLGDTALFSQIWVKTGKNNGLDEGIDIGVRLLNPRHLLNVDSTEDGKPTQDLLRRKALAQANLKVRIGVGLHTRKTPSARHFSFGHCKKISTKQPLKGSNVMMNFFMVDSLDLNLDMDQLTLDFPNFSPQPFTSARLQGQCRRVAANNFFNGVFDGSGFVVRDFYMRNIKSADVKIHATEIARIREVEASNVVVEGNPLYKWIE